MIENIPGTLISPVELEPGDQFYFPDNKGSIFTVITHIPYPNGDRKYARCMLPGKLLPFYFSKKAMAVKLKTKI